MLKTNSFQFCPHFQLCTMESSKPFFHIVCEISPEGVFLALVRKELPVLLKIDNYVHFSALTSASQQALRVLKVQLWTENYFQRTFVKPIWNSCTDTEISSLGGKKRERFLFYLYVGQIYLNCSRNFSWFWCRQVFQSENRWLQHKVQHFIAPQSQKDLFILHLICASCPSVIMIQHGDMLKDH